MLDLAIRGAEVIDGTGATRQRMDIGIRGGRIEEIGQITESARRTISADGLIAAPGFVDVHTHYDAQVFWDPALTPSCLHGVTTVLGGNCGFSIAPMFNDSADYLLPMLARVEGMPLGALRDGVTWNWETTAEYLDRLEGNLGLNAGFMVGHSAIRRSVMGKAATGRHATPHELQAMKTLLATGIASGGLGFSSSLAPNHTDTAGEPVPSRHASDEELIGLAEVCGAFPGTSLELLPHGGGDFPGTIVELMAAMSAQAQRPLNWNMIQVRADNLVEVEKKLQASDRAAAVGGKVVGLLMPTRVPVQFNFGSGFVLDTLPGWAKPMALGDNDKMRLLSSDEGRRALEKSASQPTSVGHLARWEAYEIREAFSPHNARYVGRSVGAIADEQKKRPFDALIDIVVSDKLQTRFGFPAEPDSPADWAARAHLMSDQRVVIGASDAGAHLDMLGTFNYPTRLLAAVREYRLMNMEAAIRFLTSVPADLYGLRDRGLLRKGSWADIVIFDEENVDSENLTTRRDLPGGAGRLYAAARGIRNVIVNGSSVVEDGSLTGSVPGKVLRSGRDTVTPSMR